MYMSVHTHSLSLSHTHTQVYAGMESFFYVCVHMVFVYRVAEHTDKTRVTVTIYVSIW